VLVLGGLAWVAWTALQNWSIALLCMLHGIVWWWSEIVDQEFF
jgi:hypothetical protein